MVRAGSRAPTGSSYRTHNTFAMVRPSCESGGSKDKPRDIRTLRRWRTGRRGPSFLEIGGRYFYTVQALRDLYHRSVRGGHI